MRRGSRQFLRATTTGTIAGLISGDLRDDDIVQISTSARATLGNTCLAGACAHIGALVTMAGMVDPAQTLAQLATRHHIPSKRPQVSVLYTYPSYLGALIETGLRLGYRPADFGLKEIAAGGEIVTQGLRARCEQLFGPVHFGGGYGMTEIWPFGGDLCEQGHLHFDPAKGLLEMLDPETGTPALPGQAGAIVATPFPPFRETTPLLRYNTEDMARPLGGQWSGIGLGDLLMAAVFPLVMRKGFGCAAGRWTMAIVIAALTIVLALPIQSDFPVMVVLGPLMVLQYAYWRRARGPERTTFAYVQVKPAQCGKAATR